MTEDPSPENLRKFLLSEDTALVRMGISMAKGAGLEVTVKDLEHFLKSDDTETIKTGIMLADEAGVGDEAMKMLCEALGDADDYVRQDTAKALGKIGDARAVEPLIKCEWGTSRLEWDDGSGGHEPGFDTFRREQWTGWYAVEALGKIGDKRAVKPLIYVLSGEPVLPGDDDFGAANIIPQIAADALGDIGDIHAIPALIQTLKHDFTEVRSSAAHSLSRLGWEPETDEQRVSYSLAGQDWDACVELGASSTGMIEALIRIIDQEHDLMWTSTDLADVFGGDTFNRWERHVCCPAIRSLGEIGDPKAIPFIEPHVHANTNAAKRTAKEALEKLGHEVE